MKHFLVILLLFSNNILHAQLIEDFADGDFTNNPQWIVSNNGTDFIITDGKLRSNSSNVSSNFFLSTPNTLSDGIQWEFWVNLQFSTSGSNYMDIYVMSDKADLKSSLINGYFVRIGNTDDEISLYRRSGTSGSAVKIIDGVNGSVGASNNTVNIRLKRDNIGNFTLEREIVSSNSIFFTEGSTLDLTHTTTTHFGILIQQSTASFFHKHYFDNIKIAPIVADNIPPIVNAVSNIDSNTLEITFSEAMDSVSAKVPANYLLSGDSPPVLSISTTNDPAKFLLKLADALKNGTYIISTSNLKDRNGNPIGLNNSGSFTYVKPYITKFGDVVINEIFADPTPQIDLPSVEFVELRNNTTEYISLKNWKFSDSGSSATFGEITINPHSFLIICAKADTAEYKSLGRVFGLSPWPSLNNSGELLKLISAENLPVDSVQYSDTWHRNSSKKQGGWSLERRDPLSNCEGLFNWFTTIDSSGGTPGKENSIYQAGYDMLPFRSDSLKLLSDTTIKIYFNKHVNSSTLLPENFEIIPGNSTIKKITADSEFRTAVITYDKQFLSGIEYNIRAYNLKDCGGRLITDPISELKFKINNLPPVIERPDTAILIITEIFADPSPEIHLPLVEFIEIYNPSKDTVDLDKWTLSDPVTKTTIREQKILPGEYVIFCPTADTVHYRFFGKVIGLNPWPSLNNGSDQIVIRSFKNRTVDSLTYYEAWYHNNSKKSGGWSIEKIDLTSACENMFNWTASIDTMGGTPGKKNSVYTTSYDLLALTADSLKLTSDTTFKVFFNKHLNSASILAENFHLTPENPIKTIISDAELKQVSITYDKKFQTGTEYLLSVANLSDCSGSIIKSSILKFITSQPPPPVPERIDTAKIIITEIFADPSPEVHLPLVEFLEIYNPSKDTVDLDKWTLNDPTAKTTIRGQKLLPGEHIILCPVADTIHFKPYGKTVGLSPWPSLNNNADQIVLKSFKNRLVDSISYTDAWYHDTTKKMGGWSLEKIDLNSSCEGFFNWTASIDSMGGTPGKTNSANISDSDGVALKADSLKLASDTSLKIFFNKHLNSASLSIENFNLFPGNFLKQINSDPEVREVHLIYTKKFQAGTEYNLSVSNLKDCAGNLMNGSQTVRFKTSEPPPPVVERTDTARIFITEIFADPSPEVGLPLVEFIELFNPGSDMVSLDKWTLSDTGTKGSISNVTMAPGEYLILCPLADTLLFKQLGKTKGITPWPSLGNVSDKISLKSFRQRVVDSVEYNDQWYKDRRKKNGGWSLEKIDLLGSSCSGFYNWSSSIDPQGGTPGRANSINVPQATLRPIKIDSLKHTSDSTVTVYLNTIPDTSHLVPSHFVINNGIGKALSILIEEDYWNVHLKFGAKFQEGFSYTLTADSLFSCTGQKITALNNHSSFNTPIIPEIEYPIVINEILADPSPQVGLPEIEFVELYNYSDSTVSLKGMSYGDLGLQHKFASGEIAAKSYLILCPEKDTLQFSVFGKVKGLPLWPSLANDKDAVVLKDNRGKEFHKVVYDAGWYKDSEKKRGGYSLEMINPASICAGSQNWKASIDASGGTPGKVNSVHNNDPVGPLKLIEAILLDSVTVQLTFNKAIDSLSALSPDNYIINNGVAMPDSVLPLPPAFEQVQLKFKESPARGHTYKIMVKNVTDCAGTNLLTGFDFAELILTERITMNSILVSELLFNPRPGGVDFVEIYNNTNHTLDLQELSIATIVKDTINSPKRVSSKQLLFEPGNYLAITSDPEIIKKEYRTENPDRIFKGVLPAFNDDQGIVVLLSNGVRVDQLNYVEKMHFQLLKNMEGVSLERSSFKLNTNEAGNFRSATAASGFATPGYKNSQDTDDNVGSDEFALTSRTFSPDNDGFEDLLQVSYHMPIPGMVANVKIFNDKGMLIRNLLKNSTLNSRGMIVWDGLNDFNTAAGIGIYFIYAEIFDTSGNVKQYRKSFALAVKL